MSKLINITPSQEEHKNFYCIVDFVCCEIVDTNNMSAGDYGYSEIWLPLEDASSPELIVSNLCIREDCLYGEDRLPELKSILFKLREAGDQNSEYQIVKFTKKIYHFMSFDVV